MVGNFFGGLFFGGGFFGLFQLADHHDGDDERHYERAKRKRDEEFRLENEARREALKVALATILGEAPSEETEEAHAIVAQYVAPQTTPMQPLLPRIDIEKLAADTAKANRLYALLIERARREDDEDLEELNALA